MSLGTVVVDEVIIPIRQIFLRGDAFVIRAELRGPLDAFGGETIYSVHSPQGQLVYTGRMNILHIVLKEGDQLVLTVNCDVQGKLAASYG